MVPRREPARLTQGSHFPHRRLTFCDAACATFAGCHRGLSLRYLFEDYALDTDRRELHRGPDVLSVAPQVFDLLEYLVRHRERVVSKDDLIDAIWNGRVVSDAALTTRMNVARGAIGDTGEQQRLIKTLPRKGFRFVGQVKEAQGPEPDDGVEETPRAAPTLPDKPSIAVLPFANLSSDPEQEYFADGIVEDITMALSRFPWLFVIARNSSFTYKGRTVDVKLVGRDLGVRYVLEGSVRKTGSRMRIAGQLINAQSGEHLWADHFDGSLEDMFDLQDHVTASVVGAIAPKLEREEFNRARRKPPESLSAYDHYLRGMAKSPPTTIEVHSEALQHFLKAIELDPGLACAYGMAAWCYVSRKVRGWMTDQAREIAEATRLARKATRLGGDDPVALCMGGYALAVLAREFDDAEAFIDRGLAINPNLAQGWRFSAWLRIWTGEPDLALEHVARAVRLSPLDPQRFAAYGAVAYAHFLEGRYEMAAAAAEKAMRNRATYLVEICVSAASNALAGRPEPARIAMSRALECNPELRASNLGELIPFRRPEDLAKLTRGLRNAGLPD
jgi:TolB-like protein/tetratricopeptide (TPR) repeat protein